MQQDFKGQGHYDKVKSRSHHDVAHLQPLTNGPTKRQLPSPYGFRDLARTRFYRLRSLQQGQIKVRPWRCTSTRPNQCPYQVSTSYTLRFPIYSPDKILEVKVTTTRSKVKSRSNHNAAHLHLLTNVPTRYQLPINFLRYSPDKLFPAARLHARPPTHPDTMGENNTPTALKGCGVKTRYQS